MIMMKKLLLGVAAVLIMAVAVTCNPTPLGRIIGITVVTAIKHYFNKKSEVQIPALSNPETVGDRSDKKIQGHYS